MKKIESGIPIKDKSKPGPGRPATYPFLLMNVDDSVSFTREEWTRARNSMYHAIRKGFDFKPQYDNDSVRVWRIK